MQNWIKWDGGKRPVSGEIKVNVKFRGGGDSYGPAHLYRWFFAQESSYYYPDCDIIAYRIIPEPPQE